MDDVITAVWGGGGGRPTTQCLQWHGTGTEISLPGETKYSLSVKNMMSGEGDWTCKKEVFGWQINTEADTVALPEQKHLELLQLLAIPATQRWMVRKELERLVVKLCSMHIAVLGAVAHLYHIQRALTQG